MGAVLVDNYLPGTAGTGGCYLCGASKRADTERVVDTGITIDFEGRVALCESCIRELAAMVGVVDDGDRVARMQVTIERLSAALAEATERADAADAAVEANFAYIARRDAANQEADPVKADA